MNNLKHKYRNVNAKLRRLICIVHGRLSREDFIQIPCTVMFEHSYIITKALATRHSVREKENQLF